MMFTLAKFQYANTMTTDHKAPIWQAYDHEPQSNFTAELLRLVLRTLVISSSKPGKNISSDLAQMPYDLKIFVEFLLIRKHITSTIRYLFRHLVVNVFKTLRCNCSLLRLGCTPGHSEHELFNSGFFFQGKRGALATSGLRKNSLDNRSRNVLKFT